MDADTLGVVYLLHYEQPMHHAQHYLGWTNDLPTRLRMHASGTDAARAKCVITTEFTRRNIEFAVACTWTGTLALEKQLKRQKNSRRLCPLCRLQNLSLVNLPNILPNIPDLS